MKFIGTKSDEIRWRLTGSVFGGIVLEGLIVAYADDIRIGVIKTAEGGRFTFARADWLSTDIDIVAGMRVTFERSHSAHGNAVRVTVLAKTAPAEDYAS